MMKTGGNIAVLTLYNMTRLNQQIFKRSRKFISTDMTSSPFMSNRVFQVFQATHLESWTTLNTEQVLSYD